MVKINVEKLQSITKEAIRKGKEARQAEENLRNAEAAAEVAEWHRQAKSVLDALPALCEKAATDGKNAVCVMKEKNYHYSESNFNQKNGWAATITNGPGLFVLEALAKTDLNVQVKYQHDGVGMESWAEIWVNWA